MGVLRRHRLAQEPLAKSPVKNGHKVSQKIHSIKSMQNARTLATQYAEYMKAYHGKIYQNLNSKTMRDFLQSKLDQVSGPTVNIYISTSQSMERIESIRRQSWDNKGFYERYTLSLEF